MSGGVGGVGAAGGMASVGGAAGGMASVGGAAGGMASVGGVAGVSAQNNISSNGLSKINEMEKGEFAKMSPMDKSIEESKKGDIGGLQGVEISVTNNQDFSIEVNTEINIENNMINFNDRNLSNKIFNKFAEKIDNALMLALLLAIQKEDKDKLIELLNLALVMSAMNMGGGIDMYV